MRREKSLRIGVHHADAVVWGPVYKTRLVASIRHPGSPPAQRGGHPVRDRAVRAERQPEQRRPAAVQRGLAPRERARDLRCVPYER
jgi:hypothetical protein